VPPDDGAQAANDRGEGPAGHVGGHVAFSRVTSPEVARCREHVGMHVGGCRIGAQQRPGRSRAAHPSATVMVVCLAGRKGQSRGVARRSGRTGWVRPARSNAVHRGHRGWAAVPAGMRRPARGPASSFCCLSENAMDCRTPSRTWRATRAARMPPRSSITAVFHAEGQEHGRCGGNARS